MSQGWAQLDGNGQYWPAQPPGIPQSYYPTPADPLVSPDYEGWWRRGLRLAGQVWKPALTLHAIVTVPTLALLIPANVLLTEENRLLQTAMLDEDTAMPALSGYLTATLVFLAATLAVGLISAAAAAVNVRLVVQAATGQPIRLGTATAEGLRRVPALIGWTLLGNLLAVVAVLMCVLPVFYVGAVLMVLPVLVTLERGTGIGRAFTLFHADLGTSVARVATIAGLTAVTAMALTAVEVGLEVVVGGTTGTVVGGLWNGVYYLVAGLALPPLLVTAYADMRSRLEPFSTAYLMPRQPAQPSAPTPPSV